MGRHKKPVVMKHTKTQLAAALKKHDRAAKEAAEVAHALAENARLRGDADALAAADDADEARLAHIDAAEKIKKWWHIW